MVNIVISQNGDVTGDKGKIIAYEGQEYSEVINITHPLFSSAQYFIEYKYGNTILRNQLDSNNQVSIKTENAGYVKCQFVALDIETGDIIFKSRTWNLIIKEALKIEESHYPCSVIGYHYKHRPPKVLASHHCHCNNDNNLQRDIDKLKNEISNEEDIRFNEIQSIRQEIAEIKAFIKLDDPIGSTLNADEIIVDGEYNANELSINFPEANKAYKLVVSHYGDNNVLQNAYEKESNKVWYRSAINNVDVVWNEWTLLTLQ